MKKIYSPLLEGLLALYLGFEWIQVRFELILVLRKLGVKLEEKWNGELILYVLIYTDK